MKKRFLPFSLLLVIMILGQSVMADQGGHYVPRAKENATSELTLNSMRVNQHTGMIDPAWMVEASQQVSLMSAKGESDIYWHSMGPSNMGGRTTAVLYNNQNQNEVYIGSMGGGVFYSWNKGITWHQVGDDLMVSCMAQAADGTIYVGTGDGLNAVDYNGLADMSYTSSFVGTGLYQIKNNTMTRVKSTTPSSANDVTEWSFINDVAVNGNIVLVATESGLRYINADHIGEENATWHYAKTTEGDQLTGAVQSVKVISGDKYMASVEGALYIGSLNAMACRSQVEQHMNENNQIDTLAIATGILEIAVAPSDHNLLYAAAIDTEGNHTAIYLSEDQGETWHVVLAPVNPNMGHQVFEKYGMFNHGLVVSPENPYCLYVLGYNLWRLDRPANNPEGYFVAVQLSNGNSDNIFYNTYLHAGINAMAFDPRNPQSAYIGTDGGIFKAQLDATLYLTYSNCNRGYISARSFNVAPSGTMTKVVAGLLDHGPILIEGAENTDHVGNAVPLFPSNNIGVYGNFNDTCNAGPCAVSTINPDIFFLVCKDGRIKRTESAGVDYDATNFTRNQSFSYSGYRMPIALWEDYNYQNSVDSVWFKCKQDYGPGDVIQCRSANASYPFYAHAIDSMHFNEDHPLQSDSLYVKDIIASKFYVADGSALYYTMEALKFNKATVWYKLTTLPAAATCIAVSRDGDVVFVGTRNGKLVRVSNMLEAVDASTSAPNSADFAPVVTTIDLDVDGRYVTSVSVLNSDNNKLVVTLGNYGNDNYVLYSKNALAEEPTFTAKQGNLPKMPVYSSVFTVYEGSAKGFAAKEEHVLLGTEHGIYRTKNIEGSSVVWSLESANMGDVPVMELKQQNFCQETQYVPMVVDTMIVYQPYLGIDNQGAIYAATYGKGLFRCETYHIQYSGSNVPETPAVAAESKVVMFPNPVRESAKISFSLNENTAVSYQVFDIMGRMVSAENLGQLTEGKHEINVALNELGSGTYVLRLNAGKNTSSVKFMVY